ncbi:uncharacterized protein SPSK_05638 [Sporothrix schenckii 1099-18]|uniref:Uncharacterized protein n=2 Tax=Sporothrix schenckii TaxID=29908 RepID=U7Q5S6_SPOS1|nr:uncharacterized protein SPSK_05638 [Sporothrix schenckii 1099-18]ERT02522.1 hypothetical protein HMPREF1624_00821 [Sporothrix schenckii ATCC 58251]KJR80192.1 hypothetical protein SPSK_05638 [Sporothrix schenckii 1099-18]
MSSQDLSSAIPLVHASDGIGYRLIELPGELVDDRTQWSLSSSADGLARLKAAGRTYALRQKNTSNALVLLRAGADTDANANADANGGLPKPTMSAIATVHETVELIEEKEPATSTFQAPKPVAAPARGKWHEKFGRTR